MKKNEKLYLIHIVEASRLIDEYLEAGYDTWMADHKTQNAVLRVLSTLTESATHIDLETQMQYPNIPWTAIRSFRNVLVHDYLGDLEYDEVWRIIKEDMPTLVTTAIHILKEKYGTEL